MSRIFWYLLEALFALWLDNRGTSNPYCLRVLGNNIESLLLKPWWTRRAKTFVWMLILICKSEFKTYDYKQIGLQKILLTFLPNIKPCYLAPARPLGLPWFRLNYFGVCPSLVCSALAGELANIQRRVSDFLPSNGFLPMSQNGVKTILKSNFNSHNSRYHWNLFDFCRV